MEYQDKLGCYRVGDLKFYSKLEAIEAMQRTGIHLHWDFNEAVFTSYDWKKEPKDSLVELYRQRAQQLRDQYDYIILCYSGGADSDNVLHSFIDNDIKVDAVVSFINLEATGDRGGWINNEIYNTAIPKIEKMQKKQNFQYKVVDMTPMILDFFSSPTNRHSWIYKMSMMWSPNNVSRENWVMRMPEWANLIHSGKKVCVVWGLEKPRVAHIDGKFCIRFLDMVDLAATDIERSNDSLYKNELFYWTPDLPEIVIKQGHVIKQYLQGNITQKQYILSDKQNSRNTVFKEYQGKIYWLSHDGVHQLIYPSWHKATILCGKNNSSIFSNRDTWFFNLQNEHPTKKVWANGLDKLWKTLPDYWKNDPENIQNGIKLCISPNYFIE